MHLLVAPKLPIIRLTKIPIIDIGFETTPHFIYLVCPVLVTLQCTLLGLVAARTQYLVGLELYKDEPILCLWYGHPLAGLGSLSPLSQPLVLVVFLERLEYCDGFCPSNQLACLLAGPLVLGRLMGIGSNLFGGVFYGVLLSGYTVGAGVSSVFVCMKIDFV